MPIVKMRGIWWGVCGGRAVGLLVLRPRDRDRGVRLGARAFHVEALVAHRHLVAAQEAHALEAARRAGRGVVLRYREDDRGRGGDQIIELRRRLAVALGVELVGIVLSLRAAAERQLLRRRVGEVDDVAGLEVDLQPVDAASELFCDVIALVRARWRGEDDKAGDGGGDDNRAADVRFENHDEKPLERAHSTVAAREAQGVPL